MELSRYTDAATRAAAAANGFSGVIAVARGGKPACAHTAGLADRAEARPIVVDTRMGIASGTKLFTALAVARLVEAGRMELDSCVAALLPGTLAGMDRDVTIRHLLTHTSGFTDYYNEDENPDADEFFVDIPWYRLESPSDYLPLMEAYSMLARPGGPFVYNNGGFVILGAVIEAVSGEAYRTFVEREVLARAGMRHSGFFAFNQLPPNTAAGYIDLPDGSWKTNIYNLPIRGGGDGGMFTTAGDLARFWPAFVSGRIVNPVTAKEMLSPQVRLGERAAYGLGVYLDPSRECCFIVGSDAGVGFESRYFAGDAVSVTIISNTTDGAEPVSEAIYSRLPGET